MKEKLNIAIILSHFDKSGVTYNTLDLCEGLAEIGQDVTLIIEFPHQPEYKAFINRLKLKGVKFIFFKPLIGFKNKIKGFLKIFQLVLCKNFDIIHFESIYLTFIPWLARKNAVVTYHSFGLPKKIYSKKVNRLLAISEETKQDAMSRHGYSEDNIEIVLHGVSPKFSHSLTKGEITEIKKKYKIPQDKLIIGIVASIYEGKGHHILLEAIQNLDPKVRNKLHMIFVGNPKPNSKDYGWINSQIKKFELGESTSLISHCDTTKIYPILDIFCLPSLSEGFPLVAIEAMMAGKPVIRSNVQGASEQIIEGETGLTFESENPVDLGKKLEWLIENPKERERLGKSAQKYALEHFTITEMAKNTLEVYKKVIKKQ